MFFHRRSASHDPHRVAGLDSNDGVRVRKAVVPIVWPIGVPHPRFSLVAADEDDFEALQALRMAAMRESLERVGRFDPQRARERLSRGFEPSQTRKIRLDGAMVGFVVVLDQPPGLLLDHLYIHPAAQGLGMGSWVLQRVLEIADARGVAIALTALKHSAANRFYLRHGFVLQRESEWDLHYLRPAHQNNTRRHDGGDTGGRDRG